jgi:hypothetical protein
MRNFIESIEHRGVGRQGMEDLNEFKQKMCEETKSIADESKNLIDQMDINELVEKMNKSGVVYKIAMTPNHARNHAYGCMDLMEHMLTIDEKYMACRFFHLLEIGSKQWPELALFSKAFLGRSGKSKNL